MPITLNGDTGITTPGLTNTGSTTLVSLTTTGNTILGDQSTDTLNVANGNLVLNSTGNLIVGATTSAGARLTVAGNLGATIGNNPSGIRMTNTDTGNYATISAGLVGVSNVGMDFSVDGTRRMSINSSGQLGIGTATPVTNLHIGSGTGNNLGVLLSRGVTTNFYEAYDGTKTFIGGVDNTNAFAKVGTLSAHDLAIITGNGAKIYIADSTGNVGIGTSSPASDARLTIASANTESYVMFSRTNSGVFDTAIGNNGGSIVFKGGADSATVAGLTEFMRLDSVGNLGLGVTPSAWSTSAQTALQVYTAGVSGNGGGNTASRFTHGCYLDGSTWKYQYTGVAPTRYEVTGANAGSTHSWSVAAGGTAGNAITFAQAMTLNASGNLGVGTTSLALTTPAGGITAAGAVLAKGYINDHQTSAGVMDLNGNKFSIRAYGATANTGFIAFNVAGGGGSADSEASRITANRRWCINTTVEQFSSTMTIDATGNSYNITSAQTGTGTQGHMVFVNANGAVGTIQTTGSSTAYNTSSDYRLKNTIAPMTGALAKVSRLKPVTYKWNVDGSDGEGFIAHELAEVVPDCVTGEKDSVDEEGNPQYQGIDTSYLVATLTAAIQELKSELDSVKTDLAALKGN